MDEANVDVPLDLEQLAAEVKTRYEFLTAGQGELAKLRTAYEALTGEQLSVLEVDASLDDLREELEAWKNKATAFRTAKEDAEARRLTAIKERDDARRALDDLQQKGDTRYAEVAPKLRSAEARIAELEQLLDEVTKPEARPAAPTYREQREQRDAGAPAARVTDLRERIEALFEREPGVKTLAQIATAVDVHPESVRRVLDSFVKAKQLVKYDQGIPHTWRKTGQPLVAVPKPDTTPKTTRPRDHTGGPFKPDEPLPEQVWAVVADSFRVGEEFAMSDLMPLFPGQHIAKLRDRLKTLDGEGKIKWNGKSARGSKYRVTGLSAAAQEPAAPPAPEPEEEAPAPAPPPSPGTPVSRVKAHIEEQYDYGDAFSVQQVSEGTKLELAVVADIIARAVRRGILSDESVEGMALFSRTQPEHVKKAQERSAGRPEVKGQSKRRAQVPGTGRQLTITDPDVRALVQDAVRAGATPEMADNSHINIRWGNRRVQISHTPGSRRTVMNDRVRLRREGLDV